MSTLMYAYNYTKVCVAQGQATTRWGIITGPPSFNWYNIVTVQFVWTNISDNIAKEMLNLHVWK